MQCTFWFATFQSRKTTLYLDTETNVHLITLDSFQEAVQGKPLFAQE